MCGGDAAMRPYVKLLVATFDSRKCLNSFSVRVTASTSNFISCTTPQRMAL